MYADLCGVLKYLTLVWMLGAVSFLYLETIAGSVLRYVEHVEQIDNYKLVKRILQFMWRTVEKWQTPSMVIHTFSSKTATVSPVLDSSLPFRTRAISINCGSKFPLHIVAESSLSNLV